MVLFYGCVVESRSFIDMMPMMMMMPMPRMSADVFDDIYQEPNDSIGRWY